MYYISQLNIFRNEVDQIQTSQGLKYPKFIRRLKLSNVVNCTAEYGDWKILARVIASFTAECKTYAVFDHIDDRTYHGDLVIQMKNDSEKNNFLDKVLTKEPKPTGNFFSLKRIYLNEGLVTAINHDGFNTVDEEQEEVEMQSPENRNHLIISHS